MDEIVQVTNIDKAELAKKPEDLPLTPTQKTLVATIAKDFNPVSNPTAITNFGLGPTQKISALADPILKLVRGKDAPMAANLLDNFAKDAGKLDFRQLQAPPPAIKLPGFLGEMTSAIVRFKKQVDTLDHKMTGAKTGLIKDQNKLVERSNTLWELERQVLEQIMQLRCYVFAADIKIMEIRNLKTTAQSQVATDPVKQQEVLKLQGLESRMTARKLALMQMGQIAVQQLYGIRTVLENSVGLLDVIAININAVDTVWKTQVVLALSAYEQNQIAQANKNVAANLGSMIQGTADMIGQTIQATADVQNTGVVDIVALEAANNKMIENVRAYFKAQEDGIKIREESATQIDQMRTKFVSAVAEATGDQSLK